MKRQYEGIKNISYSSKKLLHWEIFTNLVSLYSELVGTTTI